LLILHQHNNQSEPFLKTIDNWEEKGLVGNDRFEGYAVDLTKKIMEIVGILNYEIVPVKDKAYGARDENGTWNGMVGELIRGVSVLSWTDYIITFYSAHLCVASGLYANHRGFALDFSLTLLSQKCHCF
jgi:hypothetical protein